jgi:hypothetical protein
VNIMWKILHRWWYCSLNGMCYGEHYMEDTSPMVVLQFELSVLQWTLCGRYFAAGRQCYCSLNGVCYGEHYVEYTSQQVDCGTAVWMECVTVNIMWKTLHRWWTVVLQFEWSVLKSTLREILKHEEWKNMKKELPYFEVCNRRCCVQ